MARAQGRIATVSLRTRWPGLEQTPRISPARAQENQKLTGIARGEYVIITQTTSDGCNHRARVARFCFQRDRSRGRFAASGFPVASWIRRNQNKDYYAPI